MAQNQIDITIRAFNLAKKELDSLNKQLGNVEKTGKETSKGMGMLGKAVGAIGFAMLAKEAGKFIVESTKLAARVETLAVVTETLGRNAGYTGTEITALERAIQDQGITTQASRQALALMMQAQLDLADATDLARLAQDAAVIAGTNSSEAFQRLINVITTGNVRMARTMGLQVDFNAGYQKLAEELGKTTEELTAEEKAQSRANTVMGEGKQIAGAYEDAMESVGKQLTSMPRIWEEFQVSVGRSNVTFLGWLNSISMNGLLALTDYNNALAAVTEAKEANLLTDDEAWHMSLKLRQGALDHSDTLEMLTAMLDEYNRKMEEQSLVMNEDLLPTSELVYESFVQLGKGVAGFAPKSEIGIKALEKFTTAALGAAQINTEVQIAAADGFISEDEKQAIEDYADAWGIDLPESFGESVKNFNIMAGEQEAGLDLLITKAAIYGAALRNAGKLEADLAGPPAAGTPQPPKYKPQAGGGELADVALVGERGYELIINGVVIPHDMSKKMLELGMAVPDRTYMAGGRIPGQTSNIPDWTPPSYTAPSPSPPPKTRRTRTRADGGEAQASEYAAASRAQAQAMLELNDTMSQLATAEDMEQAMLNAVNLAML